jgi:hypothetical protein
VSFHRSFFHKENLVESSCRPLDVLLKDWAKTQKEITILARNGAKIGTKVNNPQ